MVKGMFINDDGVNYTGLITGGRKCIETRTRNMLRPLVGERVAIVSTRRGRKPMVVGYVDIGGYFFCPVNSLEMWRRETCIPHGSTYDNLGKRDGVQGKWFYTLYRVEPCPPFPLPSSAVRHGRSWCEF